MAAVEKETGYRQLTPRYMIALSVIGVLVILSNLLSDVATKFKVEKVDVLNATGRQRMLAQNYAKECLKLAFMKARLNNDYQHKKLDSIINELHQIHRKLSGQYIGHLSKLSDNKKYTTLYHNAGSFLDQMISLNKSLRGMYLNGNDSSDPNQESIWKLVNLADSFTMAMDLIMKEYENSSASAMGEHNWLELVTTTSTLLAIILVGLFLFRPMVRSIHDHYQNLHEANSRLKIEIADRKLADKALIRSEQMLKTVLDNIPVRVFWKDRDLNYLGCNANFAKDAGIDSSDVIVGMNDYQMSWSEDADLYRADDRMVIESGSPKLDFEEPQSKRDGSVYWLRTSKVPLRDINDEIIGILGSYEDITQKKQDEDSLRVLSDAVNSSISSIVMTDLDGKIIYVNPAFLVQWGIRNMDELINYPLAQLMADETLFNNMWLQLRKDQNWEGELSGVKKVGGHFDLSVSATMVLDDQANPTRVIAFMDDITQRKRMEEALVQNEKKNRTLISSLPDIIIRITSDGTILDFQDSNENPLFDSNQMLGKNITEIIPASSSELVLGLIAKALDTLETQTVEYKAKVNDHHNYFDTRLIAMDQNEVLIIARNITERKTIDEKLKQQALIFETMYDGIILTGLDGVIIDWNRGAERLYGYSKEEVIGKNISILYRKENAGAVSSEILNDIKTTGQWTGEVKYITKDNAMGISETIVVPMRDERGNIVATLGVNRDITNRKLIERELQEKVQELEDFNRVAVGRELRMIEIKKEINQLLKESGKKEKYEIVN